MKLQTLDLYGDLILGEYAMIVAHDTAGRKVHYAPWLEDLNNIQASIHNHNPDLDRYSFVEACCLELGPIQTFHKETAEKEFERFCLARNWRAFNDPIRDWIGYLHPAASRSTPQPSLYTAYSKHAHTAARPRTTDTPDQTQGTASTQNTDENLERYLQNARRRFDLPSGLQWPTVEEVERTGRPTYADILAHVTQLSRDQAQLEADQRRLQQEREALTNPFASLFGVFSPF